MSPRIQSLCHMGSLLGANASLGVMLACLMALTGQRCQA